MTQLNMTPLDNDDTATADLFNEKFAAIAKILNKGIEEDNIKDGALTAALMATDMMNKQYPIGTIYWNGAVDTNPAELLGFGVWSAYAVGRGVVGFDASQTEFNAVGKTGGHKELQAHNHTGTTTADGNHSHSVSPGVEVGASAGYGQRLTTSGSGQQMALSNIVASGLHSHGFTTSTSGGGDSGNLAPYTVAYGWIRTA